jgi:hypothetical protein
LFPTEGQTLALEPEKKEPFFIIYLIFCLPWIEMFCAQYGVSVMAIGAGTTATQVVET